MHDPALREVVVESISHIKTIWYSYSHDIKTGVIKYYTEEILSENLTSLNKPQSPGKYSPVMASKLYHNMDKTDDVAKYEFAVAHVLKKVRFCFRTFTTYLRGDKNKKNLLFR